MHQELTSSDQLLEGLRHVPTAWVVDGLARLGVSVGWLPGLTLRTRPPAPGLSYAGHVMTLRWSDRPVPGGRRVSAYSAIEARRSETVLVMAGGLHGAFMLGANIATAAKLAGFEAIVVEGCVRDLRELRDIGIGITSRCVDGARVPGSGFFEHQVTITFEGTEISPGDVLVADEDGAVVFSKEGASEVLREAQAVGRFEDQQRSLIQAGAGSAEIASLLRRKARKDQDGRTRT